MVGCDVGFAFSAVEDQGIGLAQAGADLHIGREGGAAVAHNAGLTNGVDDLLLGHGVHIQGME